MNESMKLRRGTGERCQRLSPQPPKHVLRWPFTNRAAGRQLV